MQGFFFSSHLYGVPYLESFGHVEMILLGSRSRPAIALLPIIPPGWQRLDLSELFSMLVHWRAGSFFSLLNHAAVLSLDHFS
jgi:hypothetical protein